MQKHLTVEQRYAIFAMIQSRTSQKDIAGALGGKGIKNGVFFTTSSFSRPAREYKHEGIKIVLIDGKELAKQMITYNVGVQKNLVVELKKIDLDFFEEF